VTEATRERRRTIGEREGIVVDEVEDKGRIDRCEFM
jgi:hypothetical protein